MASIKQGAEAYVPPQTLNIADLEKVSIDMDLKEGIGSEGTKDQFKYMYVEIDKKKYRVPGCVLGSIKALLKKIPALEFVSVIKEGTGLQTRYQVIPMGQKVK